MRQISLSSWLQRVRPELGYVYFWMSSLFALGFAAWGSHAPHIHYRIFSEATRRLWHQEMAYGYPYLAGTGPATLWLYSPSCGLFFMSLFAYWPEPWGLILYLGTSLTLLITGLLACGRLWGLEDSLRRAHFFWILLSFEMVGALMASKVEILTVALFLWAYVFLRQEKTGRAAALLALTCNWKFQGLPVTGLMMVAYLTESRRWSFLFQWLGFFFAYSALPFLFLRTDYLLSSMWIWRESLQASLVETWTTYQHLYASLQAWIHPQLFSLATVQKISAAIGAALALFVFKTTRTETTEARDSPPSPSEYDPLFLSLSLGTLYLVTFTPMSQSLAYILWTPAWLALFWRTRRHPRSLFWRLGLGIIVFLVSVGYSDLTPEPIRGHLRLWVLKPVGTFLALGTLIFTTRKSSHSSSGLQCADRAGASAT